MLKECEVCGVVMVFIVLIKFKVNLIFEQVDLIFYINSFDIGFLFLGVIYFIFIFIVDIMFGI